MCKYIFIVELILTTGITVQPHFFFTSCILMHGCETSDFIIHKNNNSKEKYSLVFTLNRLLLELITAVGLP